MWNSDPHFTDLLLLVASSVLGILGWLRDLKKDGKANGLSILMFCLMIVVAIASVLNLNAKRAEENRTTEENLKRYEKIVQSQDTIIGHSDSSLAHEEILREDARRILGNTDSNIRLSRGISGKSSNILSSVGSVLGIDSGIRRTTDQALQTSVVNLDSTRQVFKLQTGLLRETDRILKPILPCAVEVTVSVPFVEPTLQEYVQRLQEFRTLAESRHREHHDAPFDGSTSLWWDEEKGVLTAIDIRSTSPLWPSTLIPGERSFLGDGAFIVKLFQSNPVPVGESDRLNDPDLQFDVTTRFPGGTSTNARFMGYSTIHVVFKDARVGWTVFQPSPDVANRGKLSSTLDLDGAYAAVTSLANMDSLRVDHVALYTGEAHASYCAFGFRTADRLPPSLTLCTFLHHVSSADLTRR